MHAGGTDDRFVGDGQLDGVEDEGSGLRAAESAVEGDQLLECAALFEVRVVEAVDHDVGDVLESVGAPQVRGGVGGEGLQRVLAVDPAALQVVGAVRADGDRAVLGGVNQQEADVRVSAERSDQVGVALLDLLGAQPALLSIR